MAIISQETWDKFTEEEKEEIRNAYIAAQNKFSTSVTGTHSPAEYVLLFGKENLQPKPKIRIWEDVEKKYQYYNDQCESLCKHLYDDVIDDNKIRNKLIATYKIAKLIEFGYGGIITEKEWEDYNRESFWGIECYEYTGSLVVTPIEGVRVFPSFHTQQQAEEFMSYPENVELVKQYNIP